MVAVGSGRDDVEIINLDASSTTCKNLEHFPSQVIGAVGALGPKLEPVICGGFYNSGNVDENSCYSLQKDTWQLLSLMNQNRRHAAIAPSPYPSDNFSVIVSGGYNGSDWLDTVEIWNQNAWHLSSTVMPVAINLHCMVQINLTTVMIIGGYNTTSLVETFIFNSENEIWVPGPSLQEERYGLACGRIKTTRNQPYFSIIAVGGNNIDENLRSVEILDEVDGNWREGPALPVRLCNSNLVEDPAGGVIIVGGENSEIGTHDTLYRLSHAGPEASWFKMPQKLQYGRNYHVSFLVPDAMTNCTLD